MASQREQPVGKPKVIRPLGSQMVSESEPVEVPKVIRPRGSVSYFQQQSAGSDEPPPEQLTLQRLGRSKTHEHLPEPEEPPAKRGRWLGSRIQLPRAPGMSDHELSIARDAKRLWDKLDGERTSSSEPESESSAREPTEEDLRFMSWLKQESDNYYFHELEPKMTLRQVELPADRRKLYKWLRFYYEYMVLRQGSVE